MKTFLQTLGLAAMLALACIFNPLRAQDDTSGADESATFQTFYDQLGNQGTWIQTDNYGYVWQPQVSDPNWQPYTNGHWVYTDQGWTWVSNESFGWATDHYGRWVNIDGTGWCWVPGYTWAPAWVSWRYGDGYAGWAPLPPDTEDGIDFEGDGFFGIDFGFHIGDDCDTAYDIGPGCYNFCPVDRLGERDYRRYYANRNDNFRLINRTRNLTNINVGRRGWHEAGRIGRVTTGGPSLAEVNAHARTHVTQVRLAHSNHPGQASLRGNSLAVYAPRVNPASTGQTFRPRSVGGSLKNVNVNRGTDINRPLQVNSHLRPAGPTAQQLQAGREAQEHAGSGIATTRTNPSLGLKRPLSSLHPAERSTSAATGNRAPQVDRPLTSDGSSTLTGLQESRRAADGQRKAGHSGEGGSAFTGLGSSHHEASPAEASHEGSSGGSNHSMSGFFHSSSGGTGGGGHHASPAEHHESAPVHHESAPSHSGGGGGHSGGGGGHSGGGSGHSGGGHGGGGGGGHGGGKK